MAEKRQIAFRLDEETYRKFQMYVLQKDSDMQKEIVMLVTQLLQRKPIITAQLERVLKNLFETPEGFQQLKKAIYEGLKRSITFPFISQRDFVVQVIVDEFCEIHINETVPGWTPSIVLDMKAYILQEFSPVNFFHFFTEELGGIDQTEHFHVPFEKSIMGENPLSFDAFAKWLKKRTETLDWIEIHHPSGEIEERVATSEEIVREEAWKYDIGEYTSLIYKWSPDAFKVYRKYIFNLMENWYEGQEDPNNRIDYHVSKVIEEIQAREELGFINM